MQYWIFLFVVGGTTVKFKHILTDMCSSIIALSGNVTSPLLLSASFSSNSLLLTHPIQTLQLMVEVEHDGGCTSASLCSMYSLKNIQTNLPNTKFSNLWFPSIKLILIIYHKIMIGSTNLGKSHTHSAYSRSPGEKHP